MAGTVKLKRSAVEGKVPSTTDLALGELALNTFDGKAYIKKSANGIDEVVEIGAGEAPQILQTAQEVDADFTGDTGNNLLSVGDVTIDAGVTVTVPDGSDWVVLGEQFSGDYDDLANKPTIPEFETDGRSETLTAASTTTSTSYNTNVGELELIHGSNSAEMYSYDDDADDFLDLIAALGSGDAITIDGNTLTIASSNTFPLSVSMGSLTFDTDEAGPGGFGDFVSTGSVPISAYNLSITGTSNPLFDDTYDVVIDGVTYAGGTWTVSGTSATLSGSASDPGITSGDTLTQANRISYTQVGTTTRLAHYDELPANASATDAGLLTPEDYEKIYYGLNFNDDATSNVNRAVISTDKETRDRYNVYMQENNCYDNVIIGTRLVKDLGSNDSESIQNTVAIGSNLLGYVAAATTQANDFEESVIIGMRAASNFGGTLETVAIGFKALEGGSSFNNGGADVYPHNLTGNTALGTYAGQTHVSGMWNTCIGHSAGRFIREAANNTFLGRNAGTSSSPSGQIQDQDNVIVLGDNNITDLYCADTSISSSDARDKTDIEDFTAGLSFITALRPVTYKWDKRSWYVEEGSDELLIDQTPDGTHKKDRINLGFLAQEVEVVEQAHGFANDKNDRLISNLNADETAYGVKYERLVPVLVNAIKELSDKNDALLARIEALES